MNTLAKVGAASALAMGVGVAHATINYPSSNTDVMLFAEVVNGGTVEGSYAGDSGVLVGSTLTAGTIGTLSTSSDANLASLLTLAAGAGNTLEWAVQGGLTTINGVWNSTDQYVTTIGGGGTLSQLSSREGANTTTWSTDMTQTITAIDTNLASTTAKSVFATTVAAGGIWDAAAANNLSNWYAQGTVTTQTGIGTSTALYHVAMGAGETSPLVVTSLGTVSLTSAGLTFTASSSGTPVPLPAAVWLLGSGLLGLAGVGRRKIAAVKSAA
jgi:hypothetical protein